MTTPKKDTEEKAPAFLTRQPTQKDKEDLEKAYAKYLRDSGKTPEESSTFEIKMKWLLPNLQELD